MLCKKGTSLQEESGFLLLMLALVEQSLQAFVTQKNCINENKQYFISIPNLWFVCYTGVGLTDINQVCLKHKIT